MMKENKMGILPVNQLLISMAVPMMLSMLIQALYNIVDSMFVAQISENALTAVSLAFPFQNLLISVGVGTGVGVNSLLSRLLGEQNREEVGKTAMNALFLALCGFLIFALIGTACVRPFFEIQTDVPEIVESGVSYMSICTIFSAGVMASTMCEKLLAATGKTVLTMVTQLSGALINIILDPIMIFGLFGFPAMGVAGAAAATVIGQSVGGILGIWLNHSKNPEIVMHWRRFRPDFRLIHRIYSVGLPAIIMQSVGSVMTFGMNLILIPFTTTAAAVFGIYFKLQSFVFMPLFGMNNAMVPIVAYNYGARKPDRIRGVFKWGLLYGLLIMTAGFLIFEFAPGLLLQIFAASENMLRIGIPALRIIALTFIPAAFGIVASGVFQATGHGMFSLWQSLIRQLVVLLPCAWLFSFTGNLDVVWLAFPISEIISATFSFFCLKWIFKHQVDPLDHPSAAASA
ncbi:MAG: MATE family efflux transporter [Erysipelotrichaceae bacterium]|nr:MATE family efflux transporter [Erysipelotrichaceae bacterium]